MCIHHVVVVFYFDYQCVFTLFVLFFFPINVYLPYLYCFYFDYQCAVTMFVLFLL